LADAFTFLEEKRMGGADVVRRLQVHRVWVNRNLMQAAKGLSEEQLRRPFGIGQGAVWNSLLHMYAAEYVWLEALCGRASATAPGDLPGKLPGNQQGEGAIASLDELERRWDELTGHWEEWDRELTDAGLEETIAKVSTSIGAGKRFLHTKADVVLHVCMHGHYTAAQVVNMLRQLGAELPQTMLIMLSRNEQGV